MQQIENPFLNLGRTRDIPYLQIILQQLERVYFNSIVEPFAAGCVRQCKVTMALSPLAKQVLAQQANRCDRPQLNVFLGLAKIFLNAKSTVGLIASDIHLLLSYSESELARWLPECS